MPLRVRPQRPSNQRTKGLVAETFDWDEEEVSYDKEVTQVKVLMALADDELTIRKNHAHNGEWIDITIRKEFQENSNDEVDERSCEEYLRDLDIEFHERALLANSKRFIKKRK
nr:retrovirus-related Pol polyprotein from transposon TNT 1-94 [Tanacetum cinerariifolium]